MTKPFYAEYANHAFRYYARHIDCKPTPEQASNYVMWTACDKVSKRFPPYENAIIMDIYRSKLVINEAVRRLSGELRMPENKIWQLINKYSRAFAKERGLI